eukprot:CAMPEP_0202022618 /NCGR_PEP_ID=MMETSP0905-20130828/49989_1 /ASSEMBLY_ACC=CAM_ASM_000554 /TAXON_ID=420261 /ORGANISM="Thalassiosira antarctica, Strain CCMP982" /LENGTH=280 /DNA_ID=CAMNT_0048584807 /DNA_START=11 /DNA_END=850 /DNA_ORIENTATION=-
MTMTIATSPNNPNDNAIQTTIKAVIFDLDGTLLDTEALSCRAVIESFASTSLTIPQEILASLEAGGFLLPWELKRRILGMRGSDWVPIVLAYAQESWGVDMDLSWKDGWQTTSSDNENEDRVRVVEKFWKAWEVRLNGLCAEVKACPGAPELVEGLRKARVPMAIATSSRAASVQKKRCKHEKMFQSFQEIVTGDDPNVKNGKPAPDIYLEAAKRLGVHPSECLVFEDALTGAQSGKSAGCRLVAVPDSRMEKQSFLSVSDEIIEDLWQFSGKRWGIPLE